MEFAATAPLQIKTNEFTQQKADGACVSVGFYLPFKKEGAKNPIGITCVKKDYQCNKY